MISALYRTGAVSVACIVVAAYAVTGIRVTDDDQQYEERPSLPDESYRSGRDEVDQPSGTYETEAVVRPISYTYFSPSIRNALTSRNAASAPGVVHQFYEPTFDLRPEPDGFAPPPLPPPPPRVDIPILTDNVRQQTYVAPYQEESRMIPPISRRTVRFPLNTVLPGNSLSFDQAPYSGFLPAVNTYSDLSPSRNPNEGALVTHNTVLLPGTNEGPKTASRTRVTNHGAYGITGDVGNYPFREFTETIQGGHNALGDRVHPMERTERLRYYQGLDEYPAESHLPLKTGHGGPRHQSERGEAQEEDHHTTKGGKGEKEYKKDHKYNKEGKGYHDKEQDKSNLEENLNKENKYHKDEEFYGEHHKTEKGGKGKKYGEGGKHKKGHTTRGEHNIVKKDEFIKNTKFYDENHGGGEHEEHGEFYGLHEEKKGGNKEGANEERKYEKKKEDKNKSHDKGHEEEEHRTRENGSGYEKHSEREEEYGGQKEGHGFKKWSNNIGNHH